MTRAANNPSIRDLTTVFKAQKPVGMGVRRRAMGDQHHRASGLVKLRQMPNHLGGIFRIKVTSRLVGEN